MSSNRAFSTGISTLANARQALEESQKKASEVKERDSIDLFVDLQTYSRAWFKKKQEDDQGEMEWLKILTNVEDKRTIFGALAEI